MYCQEAHSSHKGTRDTRTTVGISLAFLLLMQVLTSSPVLADVWFLGIGNDGYYTDVTGLRAAYQAMPNPGQTPLRFRTHANHGGSAIIADITWLVTMARPTDLAVFVYSGHGDRQFDNGSEELAGWALNSYDETIGLTQNVCTDDQLADAFARIDSRVPVIAVFDTCYSGGMVGGAEDLNSLSNVFVMMSSREDQVSYGGSPYSRFTGRLIDGISGSLPADGNNDGAITYDEWFGYARRNVYGQAPISFDSDHFGSLPVVPVPEPSTVLLLAAGVFGWIVRRTSPQSALLPPLKTALRIGE